MENSGKLKGIPAGIRKLFHSLKFLSFMVPFITVCIIFCFLGVYPAGSRTMLTVDLYHQYMPFIYELRAKILGGRSLFYSWDSGLGNEYYAVFANYASSPLNILSLLFPYKTLPVFVAFVTALRSGLASLFMTFLLSRIDRRKYDLVTCCFGISYALCGWFLSDFWNIMWCDAYVLLPLICLGLLDLLTAGKYPLYVISLAVCLISNYYSGYMVCIFLIFFSPVMFFSFFPRDSINAQSFFKAAGRFSLGSLIGGAISAIVVVPTYLILQNSSATGDEFPVDFNLTGNLFDFLGRFLVSANPNIRDGMANVACGIVTVLMIPLFFMAGNKTGITLRKKISFGLMLAFLYLSFSTRTLNFIWHGFHFPNQIPYRQSYMMSFVVVIIAFMTIRCLRTYTSGQLSAVCAGAGIFLLLYEKFGTGSEGYQQIGLSLLFILIQSVVLRLIVVSPANRMRFLEIVLAVSMLLENVTASAFTIARVSEHEGFTAYDFYGKNRTVIHDQAERLEGSEGHRNFERIELYPNNICDIQSVYDVKGMSIFSSTARESFVKYMRNFGFHNNGINGLRNSGLTEVTATVLGIRGAASIQNTQSVPFFFNESGSVGEVAFYDNPHALSVGFMTDDDVINYAPNYQNGDVFAKTNDWIRSMGVAADVYLPVDVASSGESGIAFTGKTGNSLGYNFTSNGGQSSYTVTCYNADHGSDIYIYADSSKGGNVKIYEGDTLTASFEIRSYQTICLGTFEGTPLSATITYTTAPSGSLRVYSYELNRAGFDCMVSTLGSNQLEVTAYDDTSLKGIIDAGDGGFMLLTIPYTEGFRAEADGNSVEIIPVQDALCGVFLSPGVHEISLEYNPRGFAAAALISAAGVGALLAVSMIFGGRKSRRKALIREPATDEEAV